MKSVNQSIVYFCINCVNTWKWAPYDISIYFFPFMQNYLFLSVDSSRLKLDLDLFTFFVVFYCWHLNRIFLISIQLSVSRGSASVPCSERSVEPSQSLPAILIFRQRFSMVKLDSMWQNKYEMFCLVTETLWTLDLLFRLNYSRVMTYNCTSVEKRKRKQSDSKSPMISSLSIDLNIV